MQFVQNSDLRVYWRVVSQHEDFFYITSRNLTEKKASEITVSNEIPPYSVKNTSVVYSVVAEAVYFKNGKPSTSHTANFEVFIIPSEISAIITGGNRVNAFSAPLFILSEAKDLDFSNNTQLQIESLSHEWSCISLNNKEP